MNSELGFYIYSQLQSGSSSGQLRWGLLQAGWSPSLVDYELNQAMAHGLYQLPQPLSDFAYAQPVVAETTALMTVSADIGTSRSAFNRFTITSLAVLLAIGVPVALAIAWSLIIMNTTGSTGFNTVGAFTLVGAGLWIVIGTFWYGRAPFIALSNSELSAGGALARSYNLSSTKS